MPDMSTLALGCCTPSGVVHTYQAMYVPVTTITCITMWDFLTHIISLIILNKYLTLQAGCMLTSFSVLVEQILVVYNHWTGLDYWIPKIGRSAR